jgi:hypothetical protein
MEGVLPFSQLAKRIFHFEHGYIDIHDVYICNTMVVGFRNVDTHS